MKALNWLMVACGIAGLIGVRVVEDAIFYDPFLDFFHAANKNEHFPEFSWLPLVGSYIFRFVLNLFFSLVVIQFLFLNKKWTFQAGVLIVLVFLLTFPVYLYCIHTKFEIGYLFSFYMRRFVIQPLTLLLIVPLFFYRRKLSA